MPQGSLLGWLKPQSPLTSAESLSVAQVDSSQGCVRLESVQPGTSSASDTVLSTNESSCKDSSERARSIFPVVSEVRTQRSLPPNVALCACTQEDIPRLKQLNSLLLPIPYPEKFYRDIIDDPLTNELTLLAVWHDDPPSAGHEKGRLVGAIRCRLLNQAPAQNQSCQARKDGPMLYLSTLVLLSPYRRHGVASRLLEVMIKRAVEDYGATSVGAHVWEANEDALVWYRKRGFREITTEKDYYRRLDPRGAVVMQRDIRVLDLVQ